MQAVDGRHYWTGREPGHPVEEEGRFFIVYEVCDNLGEFQVFEEVSREHTQHWLETTDWHEWLRVQSYSAEDALRVFDDAWGQADV